MSKVLRKCKNINYIDCDVQKGRARNVVDITDICFEDNVFDCVICNHVLEHVLNDNKALTEIRRVLVRGGLAIITVPLSNSETTLEQPTNNDEERITLYGQRDHVRLYGRDFKQRILNAGFETVDIFSADTDVENSITKKYAIMAYETVFIAR